MECRDIRILLHASLERTLASEEQTRMDRHIADCAACRADAAVLRAVVQAIEETPMLKPPADFTLEVMDRLPASAPLFGRMPVATFRAVIAALAAALVAVAGLSGWLYRAPLMPAARDILSMAAATIDRNPVSAPLQAAASSIRSTWDGLLHYILPYLPFPPSIDTEQAMPFVSVLIAIGISYVIVKLVDGFESEDFDAPLDESYSMR